MSCSSKHKIAVQGVLGCMILLLGFWHIRYSYANKLNNKACTMADSEKAMRTIEKAIKLNPMNIMPIWDCFMLLRIRLLIYVIIWL